MRRLLSETKVLSLLSGTRAPRPVWLPSLAGRRRPSAADSSHALISVAMCACLGSRSACRSWSWSVSAWSGAGTAKRLTGWPRYSQGREHRVRTDPPTPVPERARRGVTCDLHLCCWSTLTSSSAAFSRCSRSTRTFGRQPTANVIVPDGGNPVHARRGARPHAALARPFPQAPGVGAVGAIEQPEPAQHEIGRLQR